VVDLKIMLEPAGDAESISEPQVKRVRSVMIVG